MKCRTHADTHCSSTLSSSSSFRSHRDAERQMQMQRKRFLRARTAAGAAEDMIMEHALRAVDEPMAREEEKVCRITNVLSNKIYKNRYFLFKFTGITRQVWHH